VDLILALSAIGGGFVLLVWSADRFVEGAAATAGHAGMPSLLIGMVIVGFGTSAPEMVVSAMAALDGNPDLALGNALGSNIVNTGLVLFGIGLASGLLFWGGALTRPEALLLLAGFFGLIGWSVVAALRGRGDSLEADTVQELESHAMPLGRAIFWLIVGLVLLIVSSRILVWGAVTIAEALGVSDLIIGLTIVALGTSLPELAASVMAARKGEHDIALGNLVGSNMFNLLAVVGIAGVITPMPSLAPEIMTRDWPVMMALTAVLFVMAYGFRGEGRINRIEGALLVLAFVAYNIWLVTSVIAG
jgi:cation:H+ antiporter